MSWKIDKIGNSAFWPFSKNEKLRKNIQIFGYFLILKMLKKNCEKIRQMTRRRCCHVNLTKNNKLRKFRFRLSFRVQIVAKNIHRMTICILSTFFANDSWLQIRKSFSKYFAKKFAGKPKMSIRIFTILWAFSFKLFRTI